MWSPALDLYSTSVASHTSTEVIRSNKESNPVFRGQKYNLKGLKNQVVQELLCITVKSATLPFI
jgi:hypothetical protein